MPLLLLSWRLLVLTAWRMTNAAAATATTKMVRIQTEHLGRILALAAHLRTDVVLVVVALQPVEPLRDGFTFPLVVVPLLGESREAKVAGPDAHLGRCPGWHPGRRYVRFQQRKMRFIGAIRVLADAQVVLVLGADRTAHVTDARRIHIAGVCVRRAQRGRR
uniref:Putative secreted protein n=1 Tax=Anopheles marajoara TaxID=58244 RepID=A0A2M4C607_9DIPT